MLKKLILFFSISCVMLSSVSCGNKTSIETNNDNFNALNYEETLINEIQNNNTVSSNQTTEPQKYSLSQISKVKLVSEYDKDSVVDDMDSLEFGEYPQEDSSGNSKEPIEWLVLYRDNNEALLISKYILDCKCYNDVSKESTWETSTLREWLNQTFYNEAFNNDEQSIIQENVVQYDINGSSSTTDNVFLLNSIEASNYLLSDKNRATYGTNYAKEVDNHGEKLSVATNRKANGDNTWYYGDSDWYLLDGHTQTRVSHISYVYNDGYIDEGGALVYERDIGIRPAIRIKY